jgi:hypothetical protein
MFHRIVAERVQRRKLGEVKGIRCQCLLLCQLTLVGIDRRLEQGVMI